jgi:hypothetical protein
MSIEQQACVLTGVAFIALADSSRNRTEKKILATIGFALIFVPAIILLLQEIR